MVDYTEHWRQYRKFLRLYYLVSWGGFVALATLFFLNLYNVNKLGFIVPMAIALAIWVIAVLVTATRILFFRCPRCGKYFSVVRWWWNKGQYARKCVHCGLPKYANSG